jgi:cold shock CspA family protein
VIFLTADTQERSQVKAFHRGIRHYLTKPYDPKTLLVLLEHALSEAKESIRAEVVGRRVSFSWEAMLSEGGKDLFVHHTEIQGEGFRTLQEGMAVEYEKMEAEKGPKATKVRPIVQPA